MAIVCRKLYKYALQITFSVNLGASYLKITYLKWLPLQIYGEGGV